MDRGLYPTLGDVGGGFSPLTPYVAQNNSAGNVLLTGVTTCDTTGDGRVGSNLLITQSGCKPPVHESVCNKEAIHSMRALFVLLGVLVAGPAWAASLCWDHVTTDATGAPLGAGLQVTKYNVWRCNSPAASCTKTDAVIMGFVDGPFPQGTAKVCASLAGQTFPATYFVTALNVIEDSSESPSLKATGADKPKNTRFE